ncbi:cytochrome c biogenesis CcdA family protein [Alkalicoccobacillus porphyridii]|uniref:Cytochrome c biogenesis protein CcdA n=1 Tax=Alkalicoccobacillus porphyridii TaxID=2597270 RepID=A0A553ZWD2_9BACI|nr:cytochrome c biogenesis CcdA family protein [Alkalicoccobacillus porphyridii]TSB45784.1 cytochrome c biogenesis protein CcdA [Alkalicoccobacillus porphyridii]
MAHMEISIWLAFFAGMVSFLSPCIFPLVPAYLAQLTGSTISEGEIQADRRLILTRSLGFILGFTIIFVLMGASSTYLGQIFANNRQLIEQIGGIFIVLFGLQMAGIISLRSLITEKKLPIKPKKTASFSNSLLIGFLFGAGWMPCIGLVLSSILILASNSATMSSGILLLFIYSAGLGVPFLLVAFFWSKSLSKLKTINRWLPLIQRVSGILMIILGIMLFTGQFRILSAYFARFVPFFSF